MIGISSHYVRRKYIYDGNLEYQARRARRANARTRTPPPRLPNVFSIEIHRVADKLRPWIIGFESPAASQSPVNIHCCNVRWFALLKGPNGRLVPVDKCEWLPRSLWNLWEVTSGNISGKMEEQTDSEYTKLRKIKCTQQRKWKKNETKQSRRKIKLHDPTTTGAWWKWTKASGCGCRKEELQERQLKESW